MENEEKERVINELREKVAVMATKVEMLEERTQKIVDNQEDVRDRQEQAALREKDLGKLISDWTMVMQDHLKLHAKKDDGKDKIFQVVMSIGMLLTTAVAAYGAFK